MAEILRAGQWRSAAFLAYLDEAALDKARCLQLGHTVAYLCCHASFQDLAFDVATQSEEIFID